MKPWLIRAGTAALPVILAAQLCAAQTPLIPSPAVPLADAVNVLNYGVYSDAVRNQCPVTISSGSAALTVGSGCSFTAADVGKYIVVPYAGASLTTGKINSIAVTSPGAAYTTIPSVALSNAGSGFGAEFQVDMEVATVTLNAVGSGCTNSLATFTIGGGTAATAATFTATPVGGSLSGQSLSLQTVGSYSALPLTTAAAVTGGGCTGVTVNTTWSVLSVAIASYVNNATIYYVNGANYPTTVTAAPSSGNATFGAPSVSPVATPLVTTILGYTNSTHITLAAPASQNLAAQSVNVSWGHDDSAAINAAAAVAASGNLQLFIPQSPNGAGYFYGMTSPLALNPGNLPLKITGAGMFKSELLALGSMTALVYKNTTFVRGGVLEDVGFDGNTIVQPLSIACGEDVVTSRAGFFNGPQYGTVVTSGDGVETYCNQEHFGEGTVIQNNTVAGLYSGYDDAPLIGLQINATDSRFSNMDIINVIEYGVSTSTTAYDTKLGFIHPWSAPGFYMWNTFRLQASTSVIASTCDGFVGICIDIAGADIQVFGGIMENVSSSSLAIGVKVEASVSDCAVSGFDYQGQIAVANILSINATQGIPPCKIFGVPGADAHVLDPLPLYPAMDNTSVALGLNAASGQTTATNGFNTAFGFNALQVNTTGANLSGFGSYACQNATGDSSLCIGAFSGQRVSTGGSETFIGYGSGQGTSAAPLTGTGNTGNGRSSLSLIQGAATNDSALGYFAGGACTTCSTSLFLGNSVGSTTQATGSDNILIGVNADADTAASNTSNYFGLFGANTTPILSATGINGAPAWTLAGTLTAAGLSTTGTATAALCVTSAGLVFTDTSGTICGLSAERFKDMLGYVDDNDAARSLSTLRVGVWRYREELQAKHGSKTHVGLYADDVARMDPRCAVRDEQGRVSNYEDRCVVAYLVAAVNRLEARAPIAPAPHRHHRRLGGEPSVIAR